MQRDYTPFVQTSAEHDRVSGLIYGKEVEASVFCPEQIPVALMGAALGVIGFLPLPLAVRFARPKPSIAKGLLAVAVSFAFLSAVEVAAWLLAPEWCLAVFAGMLLGFLASWAVMARAAMGRRF